MPKVYIKRNFQIWPKTKLSSVQSTGGGGGVGRLMENTILNFHFDYLNPSLIVTKERESGAKVQKSDRMKLSVGCSTITFVTKKSGWGLL